MQWVWTSSDASSYSFLRMILSLLLEIWWWFLGYKGFPGSSVSKACDCHAGDPSLIPGSGRSPGGRHGNPLQYCGLENPHGQRCLSGYSPWGRKDSDMIERLSTALESSSFLLKYWKYGRKVWDPSQVFIFPCKPFFSCFIFCLAACRILNIFPWDSKNLIRLYLDGVLQCIY